MIANTTIKKQGNKIQANQYNSSDNDERADAGIKFYSKV